jgi:hypothetical protein
MPDDEATTDDGSGPGDPMNRTVSIRRVVMPKKSGREDTLTSVLSTGALGMGHTSDNLPAQNDGFPNWVAKQAPTPQPATQPPPPPTERRPRPRHATPSPLSHPPPSQAPPSAPATTPRPGSSPNLPTTPRSVPPARPPASTHLGLGPHSMPQPSPSVRAGWSQPKREEDFADTSSLPRPDAPPPEPPVAVPAPNPALPLIQPPPLPPPPQPQREEAPRARLVPDEVVELLWFDADATPRLRRRWPKLCEDLEFAPRDDIHDLAIADPRRARAHHIHFGILTEARLDNHDGLRVALRHAISDRGRFTPPLVLLGGSLRFPFDDVEILRATHAVVKPLAGEDKKLKAALQQVEELLATPLLSGSTETVRNFTQVLKKRYEATQRALPLDYLNDTVERMLLEQRRYQKRLLFGAPHIRALLTLPGSDKLIPTYLPEQLDKQLPMLEAMSSRVIAEAHVKQDQFEQNPFALRAVTLGRVIRVEA